MLKHTKHQVRYHKSQLYSAFVISDLCNPSLCVIPFKTEMAKNQEHLRYHEIAILKEKSSLNQFTPVAKFRTVSLKEKKKKKGRYYTDNLQGQHHPRTSIRRL